MAATAPAAGQPPAAPAATPRLDSGAVVRVRARALGAYDDRLTVVGRVADTLIVVAPRGGLPWPMPLASAERVDVLVGRRSRGAGAGRGARIGFAVGGIPSLALVGLAASSDLRCSEYCFATAVAAIVGGAFTGLTTATGAVLGHSFPGEVWKRVDPARLQAGVGPASGGVAVAARLRF